MSWDAQPPAEPPEPSGPAGPAGYDQYGQPIAPQQPTQAIPQQGVPQQPTQAFPQQQPTQAFPQQQQGAPQWYAPRPDPGQWNATQQWDAAQPNPAGPYPLPPNADAWSQPQYQTAPPFYAAPPPKRSRTGLYVGLGAGAALVAGVVAAVVAMSGGSPNQTPAAHGGAPTATAGSGTSTPNEVVDTTPSGSNSGTTASQTTHTLSVPQVAGPLHLVTNGDTEQRISDLKKNLASNSAYPDPLVGFYRAGSASSFSVWLLAESTTNIADFQTSLGIMGPSGVMKQITGGASMKNVTEESPGPLGGALDCGKLTVEGTDVRSCVWVDHSTFGWVYFLPSVSQNKIVQYTQDLRAAAEH